MIKGLLKLIFFGFLLMFVFVTYFASGQPKKEMQQNRTTNSIDASVSGVMPAIKEWLVNHPQGVITGVHEITNWYEGTRQGLSFGSKYLVFYLRENEVLTVKEFSGAGPVVWQK